MIKKLLVVGLVAAAAVAAFKGTRWLGYAKNEVASISDWAEAKVPVDKKIASMRKEVGNLDRDIDRVRDDLAREIVDLRILTDEVKTLRTSVETEQKGLVARGDALKDATERVKVGAAFVPVAEAKDRLKQDVSVHLKRKTSLDGMEKALANRERIKETLERQLDGMIKQKQELKAQIDAVEAEYKALQLQQIESKYQQDDSRLAKIKESLRKMQRDLDVEKEKLKLAPRVHSEPTPAAETQSVDEILAPLQSKIGKVNE